MYKRARIIYNPTAGRQQFRRFLPSMLEMMERAGYETSCHATRRQGDATRAAELASRRHFDLVVAAGGDGTVNEVINGLAEREHRPQLGIIPAGTSNVLARALHLPKDFEAACRVIIEGKPTPIDVGKVNEDYFISVAGGGALTALTYEVPARLKSIIGQLAYYMKGIEKLVALQPTRMRLEARGRVIDEEIMLFLVANSGALGGLERLAPRAKIDDGYFDVLVVSHVSTPEFIKLLSRVPKGEHITDSRVTYFQTNELIVRSGRKVLLNLDGEKGGHLPAHFKVLPRHVLLRTP